MNAKAELIKNPNLLKAVTKKMRIDYIEHSFKESILIIGEPLLNFKVEHTERLSLISDELKSKTEKGVFLGSVLHAHSLEKSVGNTLAMANIIVVSSFFETVNKISELPKRYGRCLSYDFGPKLSSGVPWADAVRVASNYVRHFNEWHVPTKQMVRRKSKLYQRRVRNLKSKIQRTDTKYNVEVLTNIGMKMEDLLEEGSNVSFRVCEKLELHKISKTTSRFSEWSKAVTDKIFDQV